MPYPGSMRDVPPGPLECRLVEGDKVFFLHIEKTAGITLGAFLENRFDRRATLRRYVLRDLRHLEPDEPRLFGYVRGHFNYGVIRQLLGTDPVTMTMLRDPIERIISSFAHLQRLDRVVGVQISLEEFKRLSLDQFARDADLAVRTKNLNRQTHMLSGRLAFRHPVELTDALEIQSMRDGQWDLDLAKHRLERFAFVGLVERFDESMDLLCYTFGWRPIRSLAPRNVAPQRPRKEQIAPATIAKLEGLNELDIDLCAHARGIFERRFSRMVEELVDRYGTREDACLGTSLPRQRLHELLERHYEWRFVERHAPAKSVRVDFDRAVPGLGWHLTETVSVHGPVCWTGPETRSTLDVAVARDRDLRIRFRVLLALAPDVLENLALTVNGQPVLLAGSRDEAGATVFEGRIPRAVLESRSDLTRLEFLVNRTLVPNLVDPTNPDVRELGIAVNWVELEPR